MLRIRVVSQIDLEAIGLWIPTIHQHLPTIVGGTGCCIFGLRSTPAVHGPLQPGRSRQHAATGTTSSRMTVARRAGLGEKVVASIAYDHYQIVPKSRAGSPHHQNGMLSGQQSGNKKGRTPFCSGVQPWILLIQLEIYWALAFGEASVACSLIPSPKRPPSASEVSFLSVSPSSSSVFCKRSLSWLNPSRSA